MNTDKGRLYFATGIDNSQLRADAAESRDILRNIGKEASGVDAMFGKIAKSVGGIFAIDKAREFVGEIIRVRGEIESLEVSFETLLGGNKEKATAMFGEIRQFAVQTPMMLKDLAAGAQTMLGFNIEAEKVVPMLKAIGDISMGDAAKFNSLTLAFSQMSSTGKLMGQDLLQMINAGFNPLAVISEKTGKTIGELKKEMEKGKVTVDMVTEAFISATSAGGKYYGMLEKQSHGINGAIARLRGTIDDMYNGIGESAEGAITDAINGAAELVKNYDKIAEVLAVLVGTYGVYKAAVIANEAMIQSATTVKNTAVLNAFESEMAALTELLPAKEEEARDSLQQAVAAGQLTSAKAAQITALREEAAAQAQALAATEAAAKARIMSSQADISTAIEWEQQLKENIATLEDEAQALFDNGDTIAFNAKEAEIAALKEELLTVQKERETAVEEVNTATQEMNAAARQQNAIATAQESAATEINTAQTTTNTGATSALTIAKTKLTAVAARLNAVIMANPWAIAAAAVAALAYGIYKLVTYQTEAEKAQQRLNDAYNESEGAIAAENIKIKVMFDRLRTAKEGTEEYKKAKDAIIEQYGNYLKGLNDEISSLQDVKGAYKAVTEAAKESARARAMASYIEEEQQKYSDDHQKNVKKIKNLIAKEKGQAFADAIEQDIHEVISGERKWSDGFLQKFNKTSVGTDAYGNAAVSSINYLERLTMEAQQREAQFENTILHAEAKFGMKRKQDDGSTEEKPEPTHNKAYWEQLKKDAEAELEALDNIAAAGAEGDKIRAKIRGYEAKLKPYSVKATDKAGNVAQDNADMLAKEAADRRRQEEEYAKQLADQAKDNELEIWQARIDGMKEGIDKELEQNELNYARLKEQNKRRERDMLDDLADQTIRVMENADPTMFKKKNKDGKLEEVPGKREEVYREIRARLTIEDLAPEQQDQLRAFGENATAIFAKANRESMKNMLSEVMTYEQQRQEIAEEYDRKRNSLYAKNTDGSVKTGSDGKPVLREGTTQGNLDEIDRQQKEALKAIDEQFAQREETYQAWCEHISSFALSELEKVLEKAQQELKELEESGTADSKELAEARAKVNTAQDAVKKAKAKESLTPGQRTIKEWQDLYSTLNEVKNEFESIGDTVGGVVGEIVKECGSAATSTLQMINGIVTLMNWSTQSIKITADTGSKAIASLEKASVILAVISAAMQIAMQVVNLFNSDGKKQKEIESLQERIDQLQWELDNQDTGKLQSEYGTAIERLNKALYESRKELAAGLSGWERMVLLTRRASQNTELMRMTAEKLAHAYATMSYTADKALGAEKYKSASDQLKNIAQQQILIQEQINAEASKKKSDKSAIDDWKKKIEELGKEALDLINDMVEEIIGDTSSGIADTLADAFFDAFEAGENAAKAWGDKVNEIVADVLKRMMVSKFLEEPLGEIFDKYKAKWFKDGQFQGIDSIVNSMNEFAADLNGQFDVFKSAVEALPPSLQNMLSSTGSYSQEASRKGFEAMSEDTAGELNGRFTALQISNEAIRESTALLATSFVSMLPKIETMRQMAQESRDCLLITVNHLAEIAKHTKELPEMNERLASIEKNTKNL